MKKYVLQFVMSLVFLSVFNIHAAEKPADLSSMFRQAVRTERIDKDIDKAVTLYQEVIDASGRFEKVKARALMQLGGCYETKEQFKDAADCYNSIIQTCQSQRSLVSSAQAKLKKLEPALAEIKAEKDEKKLKENKALKSKKQNFDKLINKDAWSYISGRVKENYGQACDDRKKYDVKVYGFNEDEEFCCGGMVVYKNGPSTKNPGDKIPLGEFSDRDTIIVSSQGQKLESEFTSANDTSCEICVETDVQISSGETVCFGWQPPRVVELESDYDLYDAVMECDAKPGWVESVFLVTPADIGVIDPNIPVTNHQKLDNLNVYEWTGSEIKPESGQLIVKLGKPGLQSLINKHPKGGTYILKDGVYTEPLVISKPMTIRGESLKGCRFEVVSPKSAIWVRDLKEDEKVVIENLTVNWRYDKEYDDSRKEYAAIEASGKGDVVINCCLIENTAGVDLSPLGVYSRSSCSMTLSNSQVNGAFAVGICIDDVSKGIVHDCFVTDTVGAGINVRMNGNAEVQRNIISGNKGVGLSSRGNEIIACDNIIKDNDEEGIVLGGDSRGEVKNNIIVGNDMGVYAFASKSVLIANNVIGESSTGIFFTSFCRLEVNNNILFKNEIGLLFLNMSNSNGNELGINTYWGNRNVSEGFKYVTRYISSFKDSFTNSYYAIEEDCKAAEENQGLTNTEVFERINKRRNDDGIIDYIVAGEFSEN